MKHAQRFFLSMLLVPTALRSELEELTADMGITSEEVISSAPFYPPVRLFKKLGSAKQVACLLMDSEVDLVEDLFGYLRGEKENAILIRLMIALADREIAFFLGFSTTSGNRVWKEARISTGGLFYLKERFIPLGDGSKLEALPEIGLLVKPIGDCWSIY